jgi:single-strand DNA-binding protein
MGELTIDLNRSVISGTVMAIEPYYKNKFGQFIRAWLEVPRTSEKNDTLPIVMAENMADKIKLNDKICAQGDIRSANIAKTKGLSLFLFAKSVNKVDYIDPCSNNQIEIVGHLSSHPKFYQGENGRHSTQFLIANNRDFGKSSYIPVVAWKDGALETKKMDHGSTILIQGRLQSRSFGRTRDNEQETQTVLEISTSQIQKVS